MDPLEQTKSLSWTFVLAHGTVTTATACQYGDFFFALQGGSGGTYGVVIPSTVKAHSLVKVAGQNLAIAALGSDMSGLFDVTAFPYSAYWCHVTQEATAEVSTNGQYAASRGEAGPVLLSPRFARFGELPRQEEVRQTRRSCRQGHWPRMRTLLQRVRCHKIWE